MKVLNLRCGQQHAYEGWFASEEDFLSQHERSLVALRQVMSSTEDVGERFPEEARRIHYGEVEERGIRGRASREDAEALREEGIEVTALAVPDALKGPLQ